MAQSAKRWGLIGGAANRRRRRLRGSPAGAVSPVTFRAGSGERIPQDQGFLIGGLETMLISPEPQCQIEGRLSGAQSFSDVATTEARSSGGIMLKRYCVREALLKPRHDPKRQIGVSDLEADTGLLRIGELRIPEQIIERAPEGAQWPTDAERHDRCATPTLVVNLNDASGLGVVLLGERIGQWRTRVGHTTTVEPLWPVQVAQSDAVEPVEG